MTTTVAVTGITGFLGRAIARALGERGFTVRGIVRRAAAVPDASELRVAVLEAGGALGAALAGADVIVHCAGGGRAVTADDFRRNNLDTTEAIASAEAVRGDVEAIEREVIAHTSALDEKIAAVDHDAMALRHGLDRGLLSHYDIVRARRGGAAVAEVKGGICQGCRTRIPAQMYNELHAPDAQNICPSCNRIIYVNLSPKVAGDDAGRAELQ